MGPYDFGQTVVMTVTITQQATGTPVTGATVTCEVMPPNGSTAIQCPVTELGAGSYQASYLLPNTPGQWSYRFEVASPKGAVERKFSVNPSAFAT